MRVMVGVVAGIFAVAGCIEPTETTCGDLLCPHGDVCTAQHTCASAIQLTACDGLADNDRCTFGATDGFCHSGACAAPRCGDGIVDPTEQCDDGNQVSYDGCRADCQGRFDTMPTQTTENLYSQWAFGPTDVYAVGAAGTAIHYDGVSWTSVDVPPTTMDLIAVWGPAADDVYVLGISETADEGVVLHFDGLTWTSIAIPDGSLTGGIWASSLTNIYVTGSASGDSYLQHYDGVSWTMSYRACAAGNEPTSIYGTSASSIYAGTTLGLCYFNGATWSLVAGTQNDEYDVVGLSGTDMLVVQDTFTTPLTQALWRYTGVSGALWMTSPDVGAAGGVFTTTPYSVFAVPYQGDIGNLSVSLTQFDGTQWTPVDLPSSAVVSPQIVEVSPGSLFIVGTNGTVLH